MSAAMSSSVYGALTVRRSSARAIAIRRSGRRPPATLPEWPQSRLSKRITRKPAATSPSTRGSGHAMPGIPRPMISRIAGAPASPKLS